MKQFHALKEPLEKWNGDGGSGELHSTVVLAETEE